MAGRLSGVRWERLFDDLEAAMEAAVAQEWAEEVGERTRIEQGRLSLADRLRAALGVRVCLDCGGARVEGRVQRAATDAVLIAEVGAAEALVPLAAVDWVSGLGRQAAPEDGLGVGLRSMLRALARDRAPMRVRLRGGDERSGTIDAVGRDWVELAEHPLDVPRRPDAVTGRRVIPLAALTVLRPG